jgi:hypothetical protein
MISMFITTVYFMYLSITRATLDVINCLDTDPPSGKLYMASMPLEECGVAGGLQVRVLPAALVFLIFYCIGFPAVVVYIFYKKQKNIHEDQYLRAHGRGMHPISNRNYEFRQRFSRLYYQYKPNCYWWIVVIVVRKFAICFAGVALRTSATFQLCFALVVMFTAFVMQVVYQPFLGIKERGHLLTRENIKTIEHEQKRLRAMLVIQRLMDNDIQGDDLAFQTQQAQQDKIASLTTERDAIELIVHRKNKWYFNENNIELTLLGASVLVPLAGIMFNSRYLERPGTDLTKKAITYTVIVIISTSVVYFLVVVIHAVMHSTEANRISPQIYWARLRINLAQVLEKVKGRKRSMKRVNAVQQGLGIGAAEMQKQNNIKKHELNAEHVLMMTEMMAKMNQQMERMELKNNNVHATLKEVSVRVARSEMVSKSIARIQKKQANQPAQIPRYDSIQKPKVPPNKPQKPTKPQKRESNFVPPPVGGEVEDEPKIQNLNNLMMSSSDEDDSDSDGELFNAQQVL